jgi:class 3 adenylate cyclase
MTEASLPRGTVTFLFSDIEESTDLVRRVGDEFFARARGDHRRLLRDAFGAHGGLEIDTAGDGFFIAFESARTAVAAAVSAQLALAAFTPKAPRAVLMTERWRIRRRLSAENPTLLLERRLHIRLQLACAI